MRGGVVSLVKGKDHVLNGRWITFIFPVGATTFFLPPKPPEEL